MSDGFKYGNLGDGGYQATFRADPYPFQQGLPKRQVPNFEHKEGLRFGPFFPAKFLPALRADTYKYDLTVIAAGSPVVLLSNGEIVPAGYKKILAAGKGQGPQYTALDLNQGVMNAKGIPVQIGEYVVDSMVDAGLTMGKVIGIAQYDAFRQLNPDPHNPATYVRHNYNPQNGIAVLTSYVLEFPIEPHARKPLSIKATATAAMTSIDLGFASVVPHSLKVKVDDITVENFTFVEGTPGNDSITLNVAKDSKYEVTGLYETNVYATPFPGMTTWRGPVATTNLVTFNADSKYVAFSATEIGDTTAADQSAVIEKAISERDDILGYVVGVDYQFPKQMLDEVRTFDMSMITDTVNPMGTEYDALSLPPGSSNGGIPSLIQYAGGDLKTGVVRFKLEIK
jgi:hypothetical protein